ncbi:MAG: winged helix-turn-helix domain-containing protein [Pseudomonadota bacterium]|jgi:two-component system OmpR family response regulator
MRVLVVAGEGRWIDSLLQALRRSGHSVDRISETDGAVSAWHSHDFELTIVHLSPAPCRDAEPLRRLREIQPEVTTLALAAGGTDCERIRALYAGPTISSPAPHSLAEVEVRVRVWTRRSFGSTTQLVQQGPLCPVRKGQFAVRLFQWGKEVIDNALEASICRLRRKLGASPVRIATMRGVGYRLERSRRAA